MATFVLRDVNLWVHSLDATAQHNRVALRATVEEKNATTFASQGWTERRGGVRDVELAHIGFQDHAAGSSSLDATVMLLQALQAPFVVTVAESNTQAARTYGFVGRNFEWTPVEATHGEMAGIAGAVKGGGNSDGLVRGSLMLPRQSVNTTITGTGANLGAVSSTQRLFATTHVFSAGTTITMVVESDDNSGFSSPTTRMTLGPFTAAGASWATPVAGPITDNWWRVRVSAITGTFIVAVTVGIQ